MRPNSTASGPGSAEDEERLLADRVDCEPPIFRGCSSSELMQLVVLISVFSIPISITVAVLIGKPVLFLGFLMVSIVAGTYLGAGWFQRVKRGRPDHYYVHAALRWLAQRGWRKSNVLWRSGAWDILRQR